MNGNEIRERAEDCLNQFRLLLKIEESLQEYGNAGDLYHGNLRMDDQRARFEIWAGNIGVFAENHASLDYRLRDCEEAKKLLITFLGTLLAFLQRAKESSELTQSGPDGLQLSINGEEYAPSSSSAISSSFQGTETESMDITVPDKTSPFEQRLQGVEKSIDRLYRLSLQIRRPSMAQQNAKAEQFPISDEEGNLIDHEFEQFAADIVAHQLPECDKVLKARLAEGVVLRRRRFLYRQRHQRKLNSKSAIEFVAKDQQANTSAPTTVVESTIRGTRTLVQVSPTKASNEAGRRAALPLSQTSASDMAKSTISVDKILNDGSEVSTSFTNISASRHPTAVPNPPIPAQGSKEFECPYCCHFLSINYAKASRWRVHVMGDLKPYCCVFPQCSEHHVLYSDRKAWIAHMQNTHTTHWSCTSKAHPSCSFDTPQGYDDHMRADHSGAFSEAQLPLLRKRSQVPSEVTFQACPLCGYIPSEDEIQKLPQSRTIDGALQNPKKVASDYITKHLANHLEAIAVRALPWQDADEAKSDKALSRQADDGADRGQGDSLSSNEPCSTQQADIDILAEEVQLEFDEDPGGYDPDSNGSYEDEWAFLVPRPDDYGHDRDPVLQTFLRRLYIDESPGIKQRSGPNLPAYLVPVDREANFFAREFALNAIKEALCPNLATETIALKPLSFPRYYAVYGPGGMGKTQLAAHFAETCRNEFDVVMWVHAENSSKIEQDYKDIATALGLVAKDSPDAMDLKFTREALKRWLVNPWKTIDDKDSAKKEKASWLLIFDGVEDGEVLNSYWPYNGPGSILITSRNPYSWASSLELKPFSIKEASEYLVRICGREVSDEEKAAAVAIARRMGGLPLAVAQMGGIIAHTGISFSAFLQSYDERGGRQELLQGTYATPRSQVSRYEHNVASVWALDSLGKGSDLLNILSMLDADGIPEHLFWKTEMDRDFPKLIGLKEDYKIARNELLARSLITKNKGNRKLFVHRLVQDVCRTRMGLDKLREVFLLTVWLIIVRWPFEKFTWRHGISRWAECEELIPHVQKVKDIFQEMSQAVESFEDYPFAKLLVEVGWYCHERGMFLDGIAFINKAQSICESLKLRALEHPEEMKDDPTIISQLNFTLGEIIHDRGCISSETNEPVSALKYHKEFNKSMVKELSGQYKHDDMRLALSWNETGCAYMLTQNWQEGEECFLKSIHEMKRLNGYRPTMISLPVANLGLSYWLQEKHDLALEVLMEGLQDRRNIYGENDKISFITGRLLHAIGNVKCSQHREDEGRDYHHRALLQYRSTLGSRHHRTADLFVKLADHSLRTEQYEMALVLLDHAIEAYSNSYYFAPERLRASFMRAKALKGLRKTDEASTERSKCFVFYREVFRVLVKVVGPQLGYCKTSETDINDDDINNLVTFWSR